MWPKIVCYEADHFCWLVILIHYFFLYSYYVENFEAPDPLFSLYSYCIESFESPVTTHGHLLVRSRMLNTYVRS
jgi:hypothetical protein